MSYSGQGYHLLTALVLAVPGAAAVACALDGTGQSLTAAVRGPGGGLFTVIITATPPGVFREQIHLAGDG
jgi:hypothetical protein